MFKVLFFLGGISAAWGYLLLTDKDKTEDEFDIGIAEAQVTEIVADKEIEDELNQKEWSGDSDYIIDPFPYIAADFITSATRLHIERMMWNGEIYHDEKIFAEQELARCVEYMRYEPNAINVFMDWEYLGEFMQWQVTKAMARYGRYIPDHRLIPLRFRKFLKYFPTETKNVMDIDTFKDQQYAIFLIIDQVCGGFDGNVGIEFQSKLGQIMNSITHQQIRQFFDTLKIKSYVSDIASAWQKNFDFEWKCYDDQIAYVGERDVVGRIRDLAVSAGLSECDIPVFAAANVGSAAPGSNIRNGGGSAPSSNTRGQGGAPRGK